MICRPLRIDGRTKLGQGIRASQRMTKAMHDPHFTRQLWCWMRNIRLDGTGSKLPGFVSDVGYCLDRTEATHMEHSK